MRTNQLALSRSATDRDAERRSEPGLLERLAADPAVMAGRRHRRS